MCIHPSEWAGWQHAPDGRRWRGRSRRAAEDGGRGCHGGGGEGLHPGPDAELTEHGHGSDKRESQCYTDRDEVQGWGEVFCHVVV